VFFSSFLSFLKHKPVYEFTSENEFVKPKTRWINARVVSRFSLAAARAAFCQQARSLRTRVIKNNETQKYIFPYVSDNLCSRSSARSVFRARDPTPPPNRSAKTH
jgi:hypothetical protein